MSDSRSTQQGRVQNRKWRKTPEMNMRLDAKKESVEDMIKEYMNEYELAYEDETETGFHNSFEKVVMHRNTRLVSAHRPKPAPSPGKEGNGAEPVKATVPGTAVFELQIKPELCSVVGGSIHGAAATLVFDMCTSVALATVCKAGFWEYTGVSRTLSVNYYRPVPAWENVVVICRVMQAGKSMATITAEMRRKTDGVLLCAAEHLKAGADISKRVVKL